MYRIELRFQIGFFGIPKLYGFIDASLGRFGLYDFAHLFEGGLFNSDIGIDLFNGSMNVAAANQCSQYDRNRENTFPHLQIPPNR